jgi:hypothetical protein
VSKFTPGPWTVGTTGQYGTYNPNVIYASDENSVATVYGLPMHTKLEDIEPRWEQGLANARLIAAAPRMYEALRHAEVRLTHLAQNSVGVAAELIIVRAALAAATGESA